MAGGAKEELEAGQVRPGGQQGALHEHILPGGGPVGLQGLQLNAALLIQVAGGSEEELETGQVQPGGQRGALHENTLPGRAEEEFEGAGGDRAAFTLRKTCTSTCRG